MATYRLMDESAEGWIEFDAESNEEALKMYDLLVSKYQEAQKEEGN